MTILVGRSAERDRLLAAVSVPPAVVVIEGEAGIGKTRLVAELRDGRRLLSGACRRLREPFPLGPFVEALRGAAAVLRGAVLSPVAGALRPLLPELGEVLPPRPDTLDDRAADRHRVFRAMVELLGAVGPAVLVLEDLHWADEQTIEMLRYLLDEPPASLAVVLTYRADEVDPAARALTARLPPQVRLERLLLRALDPAGAGELAAAILGVPEVSAEFAAHLCRRASGLPLAVQELVALLRARGTLVPRDGGWARRTIDSLDVPTGIGDPVRERVARLEPAARAVLEAAAVLSVPVPVPVLLATLAPSGVDGPAGLRAALNSGLIQETDDGVGYRHVLAAQAVYEDLPPSPRRDWHARAAVAVRAQQPMPLGQLAHHLRQAGRLDEWVPAAEAAADRAIALGDDTQAARLLEEILRAAPLAPVERGRLAVRLAHTATNSLRSSSGARSLLREVLDDAELPPATRGELRFLTYGVLSDATADPAGWRQQVRESLDELADPGVRAWAMMALGVPRCGSGPDEYRYWLDRAADAAAGLADPLMATFILGKVAMVCVTLGDPRWRGLVDDILARTGGVPRHQQEIRAYEAAATGASAAGHLDVATILLDRAEAALSGVDNPLLWSRIRDDRGDVDLRRGAWEGLGERLALAAGQPNGTPGRRVDLDVARACLAVPQEGPDTALALLEDIVTFLFDAIGLATLPTPFGALARVATALGAYERVLSRVDRFISAVAAEGVWAPAFRALPPLTELLVASGRTGDGSALVQRFAAATGGLDAPLAPAALAHAYGHLAAADRSWPAAIGHFREAAGHYADRLCRYEEAQCRESLAVALFAAGDEAAGPTLTQALTTYQQLGARWDGERAAALARRHGVSVPAAHRGGRHGYGPDLSPRERQVAELAATGLTNREIAAALHLSRNTVGNQLASAMRKLGVHSRAALAYQLRRSASGE
jgi:DNA-binding CsgD family transcriptional regulator